MIWVSADDVILIHDRIIQKTGGPCGPQRPVQLGSGHCCPPSRLSEGRTYSLLK